MIDFKGLLNANRYQRIKQRAVNYIKKNKATPITILVAIWVIYPIPANVLRAFAKKRDVAQLQSEKRACQRQIKADSTLIEQLKTDEGLERYAREKYQMQRKDEDIFKLR